MTKKINSKIDVVLEERQGFSTYATVHIIDDEVFSIEPFSEDREENRHYYTRYGSPATAKGYLADVERIEPMYFDTDWEALELLIYQWEEVA